MRSQLEQVEHHIAAAFATIEQRDRTIVESVAQQVEAHGRLLAEEAAKVIGAIDAYVQTGAEAMGNLSARVEGAPRRSRCTTARSAISSPIA